MPIDLKLHNSDIVRIDNKTKITNGKDELMQNLRHRLLTRQGEYFLDDTYGLDYNNIFPMTGKLVSKEMQSLAIRECLEADSRVLEVVSIEISNVNNLREQYIKFRVNSIYGEIEGGVEIG